MRRLSGCAPVAAGGPADTGRPPFRRRVALALEERADLLPRAVLTGLLAAPGRELPAIESRGLLLVFGAREGERFAQEGLLAGPRSRDEELDVDQARVPVMDAALTQTRERLDRTCPVAPFDGVVVRRLSAAGEFQVASGRVLEAVLEGAPEVGFEGPLRVTERVRVGAREPLVPEARDGAPIETVLGRLGAQRRPHQPPPARERRPGVWDRGASRAGGPGPSPTCTSTWPHWRACGSPTSTP